MKKQVEQQLKKAGRPKGRSYKTFSITISKKLLDTLSAKVEDINAQSGISGNITRNQLIAKLLCKALGVDYKEYK